MTKREIVECKAIEDRHSQRNYVGKKIKRGIKDEKR